MAMATAGIVQPVAAMYSSGEGEGEGEGEVVSHRRNKEYPRPTLIPPIGWTVTGVVMGSPAINHVTILLLLSCLCFVLVPPVGHVIFLGFGHLPNGSLSFACCQIPTIDRGSCWYHNKAACLPRG